jgi:hypothetical protein
MVLANPRADVLGVIALVDPARTASETDLAALEYAATVLSVELARLQSVAEAGLRSGRDFAEELLAGADESTVKASAHVLGYDPQRPHRVVIATGRPRGGLDEQFFQAVVRHIRRLDVGSLVVARTDYVVVITYREADWAKLQAAIAGDLPRVMCRLAVGSRYPDAWHVAASYQEAQFVASLASSALPNPAVPVLYFDSLGVYRMLSSVTDPAGIEAFMNQQIGAYTRAVLRQWLQLRRGGDCAVGPPGHHQVPRDADQGPARPGSERWLGPAGSPPGHKGLAHARQPSPGRASLTCRAVP